MFTSTRLRSLLRSRAVRTPLVAALSCGAFLGFTACNTDYTVGFLYVISAKGTSGSPDGNINEFGIDYQTGTIIRLASSGQDTLGQNPVALTISPNQKNLFVVNRDTNTVVPFTIGTDGKLYPKNPVNTAGTFPNAVALSGDGKFLYVTFTFQPGFNYTTLSPGPGGVQVFALGAPASDGSQAIGAAVTNPVTGLNYFPLGFSPAGIAVGSNRQTNGQGTANSPACTTTPASCQSFVYIIEKDSRTFNNLLVFNRDVGTGVLTPSGPTTIGAGGAVSTGYLSGTTASSVAVTPIGNFVYVTDFAANQVIGYVVTSNGLLTPLQSSPFPTGQQPVSITIDPRGSFLYTANTGDSTVSPFAINTATGSLSTTSGGSFALDGAAPTCLAIENALGIYMYSSNFLNSTVSGMQLNAHTGQLTKIRNSPYNVSAQPTCVAAIANGTHATALIQ